MRLSSIARPPALALAWAALLALLLALRPPRPLAPSELPLPIVVLDAASFILACSLFSMLLYGSASMLARRERRAWDCILLAYLLFIIALGFTLLSDISCVDERVLVFGRDGSLLLAAIAILPGLRSLVRMLMSLPGSPPVRGDLHTLEQWFAALWFTVVLTACLLLFSWNVRLSAASLPSFVVACAALVVLVYALVAVLLRAHASGEGWCRGPCWMRICLALLLVIPFALAHIASLLHPGEPLPALLRSVSAILVPLYGTRGLSSLAEALKEAGLARVGPPGASFSRQLGIESRDLLGRCILLECDPSIDYEDLVRSFIDEMARSHKALVVVYTRPGSPLRRALEGEHVIYAYLSPAASYPRKLSEGEYEVSIDPAVAVNLIERLREEHPDALVSVVFDSITDLVLMLGLEKAYRFLRSFIGELHRVGANAIFLNTPLAQSERERALIRSLFNSIIRVERYGIISVKFYGRQRSRSAGA